MIIKVKTEEMMKKIQEACSVLLNQSEFQQLKEMIDQFTEDHEAVAQYERFMEMKNTLRRKEQRGLSLTQEEVGEYENVEAALYGNDVIRRFLYAQQEFGKIHEMLSQTFMKTIELNRLPEPDEIKIDRSCGCGGSCGC